MPKAYVRGQGKTGRMNGNRVEELTAVLRRHRLSPTLHVCACGAPVSSDNALEAHQARVILHELFGAKMETSDYGNTGAGEHEGSLFRIQIHQALGEPLCWNCRNALMLIIREAE